MSPETFGREPPGTHLQEFLSIVAHEVNTPLTIVRTATEHLLAGDDQARLHEYRDLLEMIARNADLAVLLMRRMSLAQEVEEGTVELTSRSVDFATLVRQSVSDLRQVLLQGHPVEVTAPEELWIKADPTAAREIVFNLLSNAAKYSSSGAPIDVTVEGHEQATRLVVRNHGSGVTPGDTDRIFEKFSQTDTGSSGVGLGLFISRGLARAHGGDITVRPAEDVGSEFVLELPM